MPSDTMIASGTHTPSCLSHEPRLASSLKDITGFELGKAAKYVRSYLEGRQFHEVLLSPIAANPIDYLDKTIDIPGVGQLRFNTEPEIWEAAQHAEKFYSISSLFRRERSIGPLRRSAFFIVDVYQLGPPDSLLSVFWGILRELSKHGLTEQLSQLRVDQADYDVSSDAPQCSYKTSRWVVTRGYDPEHSFFEVNEGGFSTRQEVFLVTPWGHLEVGVFGITGWNRNPHYRIRAGGTPPPSPDLLRSGMCFGLERLLLAEQVLSILALNNEN